MNTFWGMCEEWDPTTRGRKQAQESQKATPEDAPSTARVIVILGQKQDSILAL